MSAKSQFVIWVFLVMVVPVTVYADIEISGHVVTVWSDAQHDDQTNLRNLGTPIALTMANGPVSAANNPLSAATGIGGTALRGDYSADAYTIMIAYDVNEQINLAIRYGKFEPNPTLAINNLSPARLGGAQSALKYAVASVGATYAFSENAMFKIEYSKIDTQRQNDVAVYDPKDDLIVCNLVVGF